MTTYTVLMLYPDYIGDFGSETYLDCVEAESVTEAKVKAQRSAAQASELNEEFDDDFTVVYMAEGWHPDVKDQQ